MNTMSVHYQSLKKHQIQPLQQAQEHYIETHVNNYKHVQHETQHKYQKVYRS